MAMKIGLGRKSGETVGSKTDAAKPVARKRKGDAPGE
jgi:hypothetical protein